MKVETEKMIDLAYLDVLWEFLEVGPDSVDVVDYPVMPSWMKEVVDNLAFLKAFLMDPPQQFVEDGTLEKLESLASEVGSVISTFGLKNMDQDVARKLCAQLVRPLMPLGFWVYTVASNYEKDPKPSVADIPRTGQLVFVGQLVENLEQLVKDRADLIGPLKHFILQLLRKLQFLNCRLLEIPQLVKKERNLEDLLTSTTYWAYEVKYAIDSFLVKDFPIWFCMYRLRDLLKEFEQYEGQLQMEFIDTQSIVSSIISSEQRELNVIPLVSNTEISEKLGEVFDAYPVVLEFCVRTWSLVLSYKERKKEVFHELLDNASCLDDNNGLVKKGHTIQMSEDELEKLVQELLKNKKYFVILEDLQDIDAFIDIRRRILPDDKNGSVVLLTTPSSKLALQCRFGSQNVFYGENVNQAMEKNLEPFTSLIGEKISTSLDFNDNEQALMGNLKVLRNKAFDIETNVKKAELSGKKRTMDVGSWLEEVEKFKEECDELNDKLGEGGSIRSQWHGSHVKKLKERARELIQRSETFRELVVDTCETSREQLFTTKLHGESLKQELDNILARLESDQVPIFGIYGMGGVGKTTLAKHIYKHICTNHQGTPNKWQVYWVTVSPEADINKLQNDLAEKLDFDLPKDDGVERKAFILRILLRFRENVVLILDDVWKYIDLTQIGIHLGTDRCKVIITSRLLNVCKQIGCKEIIKVQPLSEEDAWTLFLEKLNCAWELSPEVEKVAKIVAKKCSGLPLGIITLARSMSGVYDIHEWRDTLKELNSSMEQSDLKSEVFPVLQISYNRLRDSRLQQCFLYCSLYPEDYEIPRDELIATFIYEGLMHQRDCRVAEFDQGRTLLNRLVNACLLESVVNYRREKCVKMHDLLRDMAVEITRNNPRFMTKAGLQLHKLPDEQVWKEDLERVSLMKNNIYKIIEGSSPKCPRLSTLILRDNPLKLIPDCFFAHMRGLRVLDLRNTDIEKLPNSISELENLTALLLGGCRKLYYVPSLRKLKALMELDISWTQIQEVPNGMEYLVKLKYLNMRSTNNLIEFPRGLLPQLSHLECLRLPFHIKIQVEEVERLKLLEEFQGRVDHMFNPKWLNKSPPLIFYKIKAGGDNRTQVPNFFSSRRAISFKECKGLSDCLLDSIPSMYLEGCHIEQCNEIESIMRISTSSNNEEALQNLEWLYLFKLENFIGWFKWEERALVFPPRGTFSSLKELQICRCNKIKNLLPQKLLGNNLRNLEVIAITYCDQMKEIITDDEDEGVGSTSSGSNNNNKYTNVITFPKLGMISLRNLPELENIYKGTINCCDSIEGISIVNCPKLERLPFFNPSVDEKPTISFPKLKRLHLFNLPEVKNICNRIMICDSINSILVGMCRQLSQLPLYLPLVDGQPSPPPSLKTIKLRKTEKEWWESLEWDHPNSINVLRPFLEWR